MFTVLSGENQALYHTDKEPTAGNYVHGKRSIGMYWDGSRMVSTRTITDEERRSRMVVTRAEFAKAAKREGIISHAEAIAWATQQALPQIVLDVFATLPQTDREDAEFEALTSERVRRTAPLITMLQGELSLTDAQVDALFESPDP